MHLVSYSELIANPHDYAQGLFDAIGLTWFREVDEFLVSSTSSESNSSYGIHRVRKFDDKWKRSIGKEIRVTIQDELDGTILQKYL